MSAEFSASASQVVSPGIAVSFPDTPVPCSRGLVYHRDGTGIFKLASPSLINGNVRRCCCAGRPVADYLVSFHGNIQIPTGGTVGAISLAVAVDGEVEASSVMTITPAAVAEPGNVGMELVVSVPWICPCSPISIRNISTQDVEVTNAVLTVDFSGIR